MGGWIFWSLGVSLLLTTALELVFSLAAGIRNHKDLLLVALVNLMTNPAVVLVYCLWSVYGPPAVGGYAVKIPLEILAVLVEAFYYKRYGRQFKHPFLFAVFANIFSFGIGEIIQMI